MTCGPSELYLSISSALKPYVHAGTRAAQSADCCHRHCAGGACGHGLSGFITRLLVQLRRSALSMAKYPYCRSRALVRVRHLLRVPGRLPDLAPVLSLRAFRMAEPDAQRKPHIPARSPAADRRALCLDRRLADAARALPGLPRHRRRPGLGFVLAALARLAVLARRPALVPVGAAGVRFHRGRILPIRSRIG